MIFPSNWARIVVASKPVDFRKGYDGLTALVKQALRKDPFTGMVFVFKAAGYQHSIRKRSSVPTNILVSSNEGKGGDEGQGGPGRNGGRGCTGLGGTQATQANGLHGLQRPKGPDGQAAISATKMIDYAAFAEAMRDIEVDNFSPEVLAGLLIDIVKSHVVTAPRLDR